MFWSKRAVAPNWEKAQIRPSVLEYKEKERLTAGSRGLDVKVELRDSILVPNERDSSELAKERLLLQEILESACLRARLLGCDFQVLEWSIMSPCFCPWKACMSGSMVLAFAVARVGLMVGATEGWVSAIRSLAITGSSTIVGAMVLAKSAEVGRLGVTGV